MVSLLACWIRTVVPARDAVIAGRCGASTGRDRGPVSCLRRAP